MIAEITQMVDEHGAPYSAWWTLYWERVDDETVMAVQANSLETAADAKAHLDLFLERLECEIEVRHETLRPEDLDEETVALSDTLYEHATRHHAGPGVVRYLALSVEDLRGLRDVEFLREIKSYVAAGNGPEALAMIEDWIDELDGVE